ncbi:hypothetical protein JKP88DRAFT_261171 [Tribonema minus]|uniref:EF-hand domain-containing protein n=1 Tax=Tribonema minus TaxID=303371 RepID=A0A836CDQ1_9STRA|nr:hypothetical protein JKP88DRAFT_261171 [Tribonema minus]
MAMEVVMQCAMFVGCTERVRCRRHTPALGPSAVAAAAAAAAASAATAGDDRRGCAACKAKGRRGEEDDEDAFLKDYENRLHNLVTLDQVFNAYAKVERGHQLYLTRGALLQALLSSSYLRVSQQELQRRCARYDNALIGTGHSHLVSRAEFALIAALTAVPLAHLRVAFAAVDMDGSGAIDRSEFIQLVERLVPGSKAGFEDGSLQETHLMRHWFGEDGTSSVKLEEFEGFVRGLVRDVAAAELRLYTHEDNFDVPDEVDAPPASAPSLLRRLFRTAPPPPPAAAPPPSGEMLSRSDLALTLVSARAPRRIARALEALSRVDRPRAPVALGDALALHLALSARADDIGDALAVYAQARRGGGVDLATFQRAVRIACETATPPVAPPQPELLSLAFGLWDWSCDGLLDAAEVAEGLREKKSHKVGQPRPRPGVARFVDCVRSGGK